LGTTHVSTALLSALALAIVYFWPRKVTRKFPGSIIALVVCTVIALALNLPVETIGSKFGGIPRSLPALHFPEFQPSLMRDLFGDALAIALLAGIESLLSAVVADGLMPGRKHDPNTELIAQGVANVVSPMFGGIPATGAIARTVANIESGGATPVAGMIHAAMLLFIMLVAAPLAKSIPLGVLSAILVGVALQMGEWSEFRKLGRMPRSDAAVFITTFGLMVMTELTTAMKYGMLCAFFMVVKRLADTTLVREVTAENDPEGSQHSLAGKEIPVGVMVYEINGAFLFGAAEKLESALEEMGALPKVLILRMNRVHAMDATALNALEIVVEKMRAKGNDVVLSGPHTQPYLMMVQAGFIDSLGMDKVAADLDQALWISQRLLSNRK
jgi:SulP family sulfate permease